jgi:hypothetical protein
MTLPLEKKSFRGKLPERIYVHVSEAPLESKLLLLSRGFSALLSLGGPKAFKTSSSLIPKLMLLQPYWVWAKERSQIEIETIIDTPMKITPNFGNDFIQLTSLKQNPIPFSETGFKFISIPYGHPYYA